MNIKKGLLIIAIALILAFFVGYGIEVFDPTPDYSHFDLKFQTIYTEEECQAQGGAWIRDNVYNAPVPAREETLRPEPSASGLCQAPYEKIKLERSQHDKIVFIVAVIAGVIAVVVGLLLNKDTISTGIVSGGVLLLLYGTIRYWRYANNILKFILLGITLAILIWIAYKRLDQLKQEKTD